MPSRRHVLTVTTSVLASVSVAGYSVPGGSVPRIENQPCPPLDRVTDQSVCSHTDTSGSIDVSVSPTTVSTERESLENVTIRIENNTDDPLTIDPKRWNLYRTTGFGWSERDLPARESDNTHVIQPDGAFTWSGLDALFDLGASGSTPPGLYAAAITVGKGADTTGSRRSSGTPVDCICLFRVTNQ